MSGNYVLHGIGFGATILPAIKKSSASPKPNVKTEASSGNIYAEFPHLIGQDPTFEFESEAIGTAWALCGLTGTSIAGIAGGSGLNQYQKKLASAGAIASGSAHRRIRAMAGIVVPRQLTVSSREDARLTYEAACTYDGSNAPFLVTNNIALPAVPVTTEAYGIGSTILESVTIANIKSWTLDFGLSLYMDSSGSNIWPIDVSINVIAPKLTIRVGDPESFDASAIPLTGLPVTHANTAIYLRRRAGNGWVGNAVTQHISITMDGLAHLTDAWNAQGSDPGETNIEVVGSYDGTNAPIVLTTGVVHP